LETWRRPEEVKSFRKGLKGKKQERGREEKEANANLLQSDLVPYKTSFESLFAGDFFSALPFATKCAMRHGLA
jgi:hypothetical protein